MKQLLSEAEINAGVRRLADEINARFGPRPLTIVGVLTGSLVLLADLIRQLGMPLRVGVVQARSYRGELERGELVVNYELMLDLRGRDVLVVDDIFDTGHTLAELLAKLRTLGPASVSSAVLLRKQGRQQVSCEPDYAAFTIPNEFVVGYGLDFRDHYRHLPFVAALEPDDIAGTPP